MGQGTGTGLAENVDGKIDPLKFQDGFKIHG